MSRSNTSRTVRVATVPRTAAMWAIGVVLLVITLVGATAGAPQTAFGATKKPPRPPVTSTSSTTTTPATTPATTTQPPTTTSTSSPPPSTPPPTSTTSACALWVEFAGTSYCSTSIRAIAIGTHPVGTKVAVQGSWVLDSNAVQVVLGRDECPPGYYCGATLNTMVVNVPAGVVAPTVDSFVDVFGTVDADNGLDADGFVNR